MVALLDLNRDGAVRADRAALSFVDELAAILAPVETDAPGLRLRGVPGLAALLASAGPLGTIAAAHAGRKLEPVRALLFDKSDRTNWALGWHQDRTIAVQRRADIAGYGPWTTKAGIQHVEPPFDVITRLVTLRVHLDDVPANNAPLLIAPGSHRLGRIPESEIASAVAQCGMATCLAQRGDVWVYATSILHASAASEAGMRRRVLQVDYAGEELPDGLDWAGI